MIVYDKYKMAKKLEITPTELRGLMFWAAVGIERSMGGSYEKTCDFIKKNHRLMYDRQRFRNLKFGTRLRENIS